MLHEFTAWFIDIVIRVLKSIAAVFLDIAVSVLDGVFSALGALISAIPSPSFLSAYSLGSLLGQLPSYVLYFASHLQLGTALGIIGAGFTFRMLRKVFTVGQW